MGLFSSKYITSVATSVSRVIVDKQVPDPIHTGSVKALTVSGDALDYVMEELASSVGIKIGSMYRYAKANYAYGLPSGQYIRADAGQSQILSLINTLEGTSVSIEYSHYGPANSKHIAWLKLVKDYQYDAVSNEIKKLSTTKGFPVYLESLQIVIPTSYLTSLDPTVLAQWGTPDNVGYTPERKLTPVYTKGSAIVVDPLVTEDFFKISYIWEDVKTVGTVTTKTIIKESVLVPITGYNDKGNYFHVKYRVGAITKYWMYESGSGLYTALDNLFTTPQLSGGSFFPMAYVRFDKTDTSLNKGTAEYKTTKKMLNYLGMDFDYIAEAVNSNPDIKNVEQAIITMAVPANSTNPIECRYLFDFFASLHESTGSNKYSAEVDRLDTIVGSNSTSKSSLGNIIIQDKKFKMQLKHGGTYRTFGVGKKCKVGSYTSAETIVTTSMEYIRKEDEHLHTLSNYTANKKQHYYFKQLTADVYEQIQVDDLTMTYFILDGYTVTAGESDPILMIPIDYSITKDYSSQTESILYSRSLHFIFNSKNIQEVKWYQQKWFSYVLLIIAIIWTIFTWGADGGTAIGAAIAAGTITMAAVIQVLIIIVMQLVVSYVVKLFVKVVGVKWAVVAAIVAAFYGVMINPGDTVSVFAMTAKEMLGLALNLTMEAFGLDMKNKYAELKHEMEDFNAYRDKELKLLETETELLETSHNFRPMDVIDPNPTAFFNRTIHSGNIGVSTLDLVASYVDIALTLPTINQSNTTLMRYT